MPYTDRHGRPEILMHPNIARGVASYRREMPAEHPAPGTTQQDGTASSSAQPAKPTAG